MSQPLLDYLSLHTLYIHYKVCSDTRLDTSYRVSAVLSKSRIKDIAPCFTDTTVLHVSHCVRDLIKAFLPKFPSLPSLVPWKAGHGVGQGARIGSCRDQKDQIYPSIHNPPHIYPTKTNTKSNNPFPLHQQTPGNTPSFLKGSEPCFDCFDAERLKISSADSKYSNLESASTRTHEFQISRK